MSLITVNQTIQQVLPEANSPYINGSYAERKLSPVILKAVFQGLIERDGRGSSSRFTLAGADAMKAAQVLITRVKPIRSTSRQLGASKNGQFLSNATSLTTTETYAINMLEIVDGMLDFPYVQAAMIPVDLMSEQIYSYVRSIYTLLNGANIAAKYLSTYSYLAEGNQINTINITSTDVDNAVTNKAVQTKFLSANTLLDLGDVDHDVDVFPQETRIAVLQASWRAILKSAGVLVLGGANYAYEILAGDSIERGKASGLIEDGYWGDIDGVPVHGASPFVFREAARFLGFTDLDLSIIKGNTTFLGYIASGFANAYGVSALDFMKMVDIPNGVGVRFQPAVKFGVQSFYPLGNVMLTYNAPTASDYATGIYGALKTLFPTGVTFQVKSYKSRLYPTASITSLTASALGTTATALDDAGVDHIVGGHFAISTTPYETVEQFVIAVMTGEVTNDEITLNGSTDITITDGQYITALFIADDGSCTLVSRQYNA